MNTAKQSAPVRRTPLRREARRRGTLLLEATISAAMLGVLLVAINQAVVRLHRQAAIVDRHVAAQQALENLLEEFAARDWDSLNTDAIGSLSVPKSVAARLPGVELSGEVAEETEPATSKRIALRLSWNQAKGQPRTELHLTTWVYKQEESTP